MNNDQEKQFQEHLFETRKSGNEASGLGPEDEKLYHLIFDALEQAPELDIPEDFAIKTAEWR